MRIMVDNLAVDIDNRTVRRGDEDIRLTAKEYEVLKYLALHKDKLYPVRSFWNMFGTAIMIASPTLWMYISDF